MCRSFCWSSAARSDRTEKKRFDLSFFLLIQLVTRTTNLITFLTVLVELESGEIEWFDYKFVLKEQPFSSFYMFGNSFQQIDNRF